MKTNRTHRFGGEHAAQRFRARRERFHKVSRVVEVLAVLALARKLGWKRGRRLVALASMALLDERHAHSDASDRRRR